jgi:RNA polymerase sigma-70 factor (ECF subfamily)
LYAILLHRYQKHVRRMRVRPVPLSWLPLVDARKGLSAQDRLVCPRPAPDRDTALDELAHELKQAVGSLPRRHRDVILLRFFGDASLGEMASVLGCSVGTVKSRLHHALEKLRKMKLNLSTASWDTGT